MTRTQFLIVLSLAAGAMFGVALLVAVLVVPFVMSRQRAPASLMPAPPAGLVVSGVKQGAELFSKSVWLREPMLGEITDIQWGEFEKGAGTEFGIAGTAGAVFADDTGKVRATVRFASPAARVALIDVEGNHVCEFLNRGGRGWQDAALMNHAGAVVWSYGGGVNDMAAGDLDGDGIVEFVVGFNGSGGVHLLDRTGRKLREHSDGNVWHVEVTDTDGDGKPEIVHSNAAGELTVRDGAGRRIRSVKTPVHFSEFSLCPWPGRGEPRLPIYARDDQVFVITYDGAADARRDAPDCGEFGMVAATLVKFKASEPEYIAVAVAIENWKRSVLYVFDASGTLAYREVFEELCQAMAARMNGESGAESLLLGGAGQVWEYRVADEGMKQAKPAREP